MKLSGVQVETGLVYTKNVLRMLFWSCPLPLSLSITMLMRKCCYQFELHRVYRAKHECFSHAFQCLHFHFIDCRILYQEIDYINEGKNADRFRRDFRNIKWVRVPVCATTRELNIFPYYLSRRPFIIKRDSIMLGKRKMQ